jgi:hypothetical protein
LSLNTIVFVLGMTICVAVFLLANSGLNLILFACTCISLVFVVGSLVWELVMYRRTSHDLKMLREEIRLNRRVRRSEDEGDG